MLKDFTLTKELAWTDFKLKYKGSTLGFFWSFLKPLFMLGVLYVVFALIMKSSINHYMLFLLLGIILWNFFHESTFTSMSNFIEKRGLIKSVYFPRQILIISSNINSGLTLCFSLLVFFLLFFIYKMPLGWSFFMFLIMLLLLFIFSLGVSYILSALYVRYRDVFQIWEVLTNAGFWITPIIYDVSIIPQKYSTIYFLNPLARIITYSRTILLDGKNIPLYDIAITFVLCMAIYIVGYYLYKYMSRSFAEEI